MFEKCLECTAYLQVKRVSCPGVWLTAIGEVYVTVQLFGRLARSFKIRPLLPLTIDEEFRFTKVFWKYRNIQDVYNAFSDEVVSIRLIQLDVNDKSILLATYENSLKDFLLQFSINYHEFSPFVKAKGNILLHSTLLFPGQIGPKLTFDLTTFIQDSSTIRYCYFCPECCSYKERSHRLLKSSKFNTISHRTKATTLMALKDRPAFVCRKVDDKLLGRIPSLYRERPGKTTYCCLSPHRYDDCAACRIRMISLPRQRPTSKQIAGVVRSHSARPRHRKRSSSPHVQVVDDVDTKDQTEDIITEFPTVKSPTTNDIHRLSSLPASPRYHVPPSLLETRREKSPTLHHPTFHERFGNLPEDAIPPDRDHRDLSKSPTRLNKSTNTGRDYVDASNLNDKFQTDCELCMPYFRHDCCCHDWSHFHCPYYWKNRLGPPPSPYNWYSFRHELADAYNDYYHKIYSY